MITYQQFLELREATRTLRCHTLRTRRVTNLAEHSYGVAMLVDYLSDGKASADLLRAALHHDLHEHRTGDIPHPIKRASQELTDVLRGIESGFDEEYELTTQAKLDPKETQLLACADMLEFVLYAAEEIAEGNTTMRRSFWTGVRALNNAKPLPEKAKPLLDDAICRSVSP